MTDDFPMGQWAPEEVAEFGPPDQDPFLTATPMVKGPQ